LAFTCRKLFSQLRTRFGECVAINTQGLRPLVRTIIECPGLAPLIKHVSFQWEEYRALSSYDDGSTGRLRPMPWRIPLSGDIAPPAAFINQCRQFLDDNGFQWSPEWMAKLESGSADAESCLFLLALPNLQTLRLDFERLDHDEKYAEHDLDFQHLFRHEMLKTMIRDPKAFATLSASPIRYPLENLKNLVVTQPYDDPFTIKSSYPPCVYVPLEKVQGVFKLPNLQHVEMSQIGASAGFLSERVAFDGEDNSSLFGSTSLSSIEITRASLSADGLSTILKFPKHLKSFHYHVISPEELFERHQEDNVSPE
jgi:hypothetical protein